MTFIKKWSLQLAIIAAFLFAVYSNVNKVMDNNRLNEKVNQEKQSVENLKIQNTRLDELLAYYQSPSYQEVEARRRLSLKKPDETVIVVKNFPVSNQNGDLTDQIYQESPAPAPQTQSNISRWWNYFFGSK
ncbi:MAG TPA: septum formation initiator family protein [Candidatus Saccharimonadales bacterium]|nr:septum formation initiator family protein [Candidatus Saccharimonadales bacterium]